MKKQLLILTLAALLLAGCGATSAAESTVPAQSESAAAAETPDTAEATPAAALPDGVYTAEFKTDSSMFHANEACEGMGTLTVADGKMVFHVSLQSQKIVNLYPGTAADAPAHEADWLQPTLDTVTYSDGTTDEVYGFDIPVEAVDTDFSLAILGTKAPGMTILSAWRTLCPLQRMPPRPYCRRMAAIPVRSRLPAAAAAPRWRAPQP